VQPITWPATAVLMGLFILFFSQRKNAAPVLTK